MNLRFRDRTARAHVQGLRSRALLALALLLTACQNQNGGPMREPMELSGRWLGMSLSPAESSVARALGVDPTSAGVVVADVTGGADSRAAAAGIQSGDVLIAVDGSPVTTLAELYTLSTRKDVAAPIQVQLLRQGQPLLLAMPGIDGAMPTAPMLPAEQPALTPAEAMAMDPTAAPVGTPAAARTAMGWPGAGGFQQPAAMPAGAPEAMNPTAPTLFCPAEGLHWHPSQVGAAMLCPRCGGALMQ
ncbi:MAG: PDZ domain-containing protein [Myxococcales bacterium]|nr:PDZ domain-containing protein [Myxococcales bacterium]